MIYGYIYQIKNNVNNKVYIGQTKREPQVRFDEYKRGCHNILLKEDFDKYGIENFTFSVIDTAIDYIQLDEKEKYWIKYYNSMNIEYGYNLCSGGSGPMGAKWDERSKKTISNQRKGCKWFHNNDGERHLVPKDKIDEYKDWIPGYGPGRIRSKHTEETKRKIRQSNIGKHNRDSSSIEKQIETFTSKHYHWYTNGTTNIQISEIDSVPEGFIRGRIISEEQRAKLKGCNKGRPAWNKGLTKETDDRVRKYADNLKGISHKNRTKKTS